MAIDSEKYKTLYEFQKSQFEDERDRYNRLEDKSVKYLTSITIAMTGYILLLRWTLSEVIPPTSLMSWIVVILMLMTLMAMASSWSFVFRSIKLQNLIKIQSNDEMINYFKSNKKETVYLGLAKKYGEAIVLINYEYTEKLNNVRKAYSEITISAWLLFASIMSIIIHYWIKG